MKAKINITLDLDNEDNFMEVLNQIGLLLIKNNDKLNDFEIEHQSSL